MNDSIELIRKIHEGMDNTCYAAILANWDEIEIENLEVAEKLFDLYINGISVDVASKKLDIEKNYAQNLLCKYIDKYCSEKKDNGIYDKLYSSEQFYEAIKRLVRNNEKDCYFSLNSFYRLNKQTDDVRHINAFVLDFDFYKIAEYKNMKAAEFYKIIKSLLPLKPTGVVDSGRGLYVIYSFKHCSYHMTKLYESIMKLFFDQFEKYGMDPLAQLVTQVIRIPGTINSKSGREVTILEFNDTSYSIKDFSALLPWSMDEVKMYKKNNLKSSMKVTNKRKAPDLHALSKKRKRFKPIFEDFKTLIKLRNKSAKYSEEGYRVILIYLMRERACMMGYSIDESVKMALELNKLFNSPLSVKEVETQCKPAGKKRVYKIETIIKKLSMDITEQKKMTVLKKRWIKKAERAKQSRKNKLLNRTNAEIKRMDRRVKVLQLKIEKRMNNSEIARELNIDRGTVINDLKYINLNPSEFLVSLEDHLKELEEYSNTRQFDLGEKYFEQINRLEIIQMGYRLLEGLYRKKGADYG